MSRIGAHPVSNGSHFKVWAANAKEVHVIGEFNGWNKGINMLSKTYDDYWEGTINNATVNHRYRFLIVSHDNKEYYRLDLAARDTDHSGLTDLDKPHGNAGIILDTSHGWNDFTTPRFENFIIYQLHIGAFAGRNDHFHDLVKPNNIAKVQYIESKLDYIKDLGFDAIELLPINEFRGDRSWGYNPSFFFAPESKYGHPDDYRHFVNEAHKRGLAVIFDVVYNHFSNTDNPFWQFDTAKYDGNMLQNMTRPGEEDHCFGKNKSKIFSLKTPECILKNIGLTV